MEHEHDCQAGTTTDNGCHGTDEDQSDSHNATSQNNQEPPPASIGITHSISPGTPCPETVLVTVMADRSYLLMAYPQREPAAFVTQDNAGLLREALTAAFQRPGDKDSNATGRNESGTRANTKTAQSVVVPGHKTLPTEQAQP